MERKNEPDCKNDEKDNPPNETAISKTETEHVKPESPKDIEDESSKSESHRGTETHKLSIYQERSKTPSDTEMSDIEESEGPSNTRNLISHEEVVSSTSTSRSRTLVTSEDVAEPSQFRLIDINHNELEQTANTSGIARVEGYRESIRAQDDRVQVNFLQDCSLYFGTKRPEFYIMCIFLIVCVFLLTVALFVIVKYITGLE